MDYIEPPPTPKSEEKKRKEKFLKVLLNDKDEREIVIQKAQIRDVEEILELINAFAAMNLMLPRGPQYLYENIRDFVIACDSNVPVYSVTETREVLPLLVACGSLIHRLYTFTLTEDFFKTFGFRRQDRSELPPKVWGECSRCPKYFHCDEVGMVLDL
ncbi:MAG: hypothetical protein JRF58_10285 [Deltaproteobacteria bacterium]|nr:hypothetical protein [Deltaproteobacteria bacterium]